MAQAPATSELPADRIPSRSIQLDARALVVQNRHCEKGVRRLTRRTNRPPAGYARPTESARISNHPGSHSHSTTHGASELTAERRDPRRPPPLLARRAAGGAPNPRVRL